jgi:hypothetical protein
MLEPPDNILEFSTLKVAKAWADRAGCHITAKILKVGLIYEIFPGGRTVRH